MAEPRNLDALLDAARHEAAAQRSNKAAEVEALRVLQERGGFLPLADLLAGGVTRETVAGLVDDQAGEDKRQKVKARLGVIGGQPIVWLTATGHAATGRPSAREAPPSLMTVQHAAAPSTLDRWLTEHAPAWEPHGVRLGLTWGGSCRRWSEEVTARAWGHIRTGADTDGVLGSLTGGLIPDALLIERWRPDQAALYEQVWGVEPSREDLAETTLLAEAEMSAKSAEPLRSKVSRLSAATERLGAARAVLWIVSSRDIADRLRDLGVDDEHQPSMYLVPAVALGLPGEPLGPVRRPWWPLTAASPGT